MFFGTTNSGNIGCTLLFNLHREYKYVNDFIQQFDIFVFDKIIILQRHIQSRKIATYNYIAKLCVIDTCYFYLNL